MVKKVRYEVLDSPAGLEIRRYPELLLASVYGMEDNRAFGILFAFISGDNSKERKIAMTAPVVSADREEPEDATPVFSSGGFFTFVMPAEFSKEDLPAPRDSRIDVHVQAPKTFAVLKFSGRTREELVAEKGAELLEKVAGLPYRTVGDTFLMRYNSPIVPGFLRTNEVGVEIVPEN